jgi:altronate dehydratase
MKVVPLEKTARLPESNDNCAIATRSLEPGTMIGFRGTSFAIDYEVLEGHRFAVSSIVRNQALLSWGLPFGFALRDIAPGSYVCNQETLNELKKRNLEFDSPFRPNFRDQFQPHLLDETGFRPGRQVSRLPNEQGFLGYPRASSRGVGTRNYIIILGTTSTASGFVRALAADFAETAESLSNVDGIAAVTHTEGGESFRPNNLEYFLRAIAGFIVHPNIAAVLVVDQGDEWVNKEKVLNFLSEKGYSLQDVPHQFLTLSGNFHRDLRRGRQIMEPWLGITGQAERSRQPLSALKLALQCGGSDAFSGISANPLVALVARKIIRFGGSANLAETSELVGAESYVLGNVRDFDTARQFLKKVEQYKEMMSWHGDTPEGNLSGGNRFRGLYNISLKSIGAATKRHPEVRLDDVIDYAEPMKLPGFYFMNSPGNDLESVAGQVASGANLIIFTTGSGSITNFPFVPTIKVMSTTQRYRLMADDMDVNAGAYLDGTSLEELAEGAFQQAVRIASSERTKGERAGHSQVSIWRNWQQTSTENLEQQKTLAAPDGFPLLIKGEPLTSGITFEGIRTNSTYAIDQVGLVFPNSLCSGQVGRLIANRLNQSLKASSPVSRFVSLVHTEGCAATSGGSDDLFLRMLTGYLTHPLTRYGMLLEHGCEKVHNEYLAKELQRTGIDPGRFGWASIQMDGGIGRVAKKVEDWFARVSAGASEPIVEKAHFGHLTLALLTPPPIPPELAEVLADLTRMAVRSGGSVVVPHPDSLVTCPSLLELVLEPPSGQPSLAFAGKIQEAGFHIMECPSRHWTEVMTGLGATGAQILLAYLRDRPRQGHPMIPLIQVTTASSLAVLGTEDFDLVLTEEVSQWRDQLLQLLVRVGSRQYRPKTLLQSNTDFQVPRGRFGFSA